MFGGPRGFQRGGQSASSRPPLLDLPPNIRAMFEPRYPVEFKKPILPKEEPPKYTGISQYTNLFEKTAPPPVPPFEAPAERKKNRRERLIKLHNEKNELLANDWDPHSNPKATENAYSTLFIGRLSYETTEKKLRREVEPYGTIRNLRVVHDTEGKPRGYAFIEFENEADMTAAYRKLEGRKIDGRRIVCDVERGRTVRNWRPARFGGGIGGRIASKSKKQLASEAAAATATAAAAAPLAAYGPGDRGNSGPADRDRGGGRIERRVERSRSRDRPPPVPATVARGNSRDRRPGIGAGSDRGGYDRGFDRGRGPMPVAAGGGYGGAGAFYGPPTSGPPSGPGRYEDPSRGAGYGGYDQRRDDRSGYGDYNRGADRDRGRGRSRDRR
jgi:U1 small nuclear ribonucleoprotein